MSRFMFAVGFIIVAAVVVLSTPDKGPSGFIDKYFAWVVIGIMSVAAVLEVKEHFAERREHRADAECKSTAIQALPFGEYEDGEPVTFHFPEGGGAR